MPPTLSSRTPWALIPEKTLNAAARSNRWKSRPLEELERLGNGCTTQPMSGVRDRMHAFDRTVLRRRPADPEDVFALMRVTGTGKVLR